MLIIFDCDGVLVDSEIIANRVLAAHLSRFGYPVTAAESRAQFLGRTIPGVIKMVQDAGVELPEDFEATLRARDVEAFKNDLKPVPGIAETLIHLEDIEKCVASSGSPDKIRSNLQTTGLIQHFDGRMFSAVDVDKPKPAPDLFFLAAARMNVAPSACVVIEDTALGIKAAKRAGMRAIAYIGASHRSPADAGPLRKAGADIVIDDMTQLPSVLKSA